MLQMGQLGEAAVALEGRFSRDEAHLVVGGLEAPTVVALGKLKIHAGDERGAARSRRSRKSCCGRAPRVSSPTPPGIWRCTRCLWAKLTRPTTGSAPAVTHDRLKLFPLFPFEIADDPQLVRIAVAAGDEELAEHTIEQAERRCELNPGVVSFKAAAAHARGLWQGSADDLQTAASLFADRAAPAGNGVGTRGSRPLAGVRGRHR